MENLGALPAAGLTGALVTLFALMVRSMLQVSKRADTNAEQTIERLERERDAAVADARLWQNRYMRCKGIDIDLEGGPRA